MAITKSIIELTDPSRNYGLVERSRDRTKNSSMSQSCFMIMSGATSLAATIDALCHHLCKWIEIKRSMLDHGSSIDIMSFSVFDAVGIPEERITRQPNKLSSFRGHNSYTLGSSTSTWPWGRSRKPISFTWLTPRQPISFTWSTPRQPTICSWKTLDPLP